MTTKPELIVESFNPYDVGYPNRRVVTRAELDLIKVARAAGISVRITGRPEHELNFLTEKGLRDLLADPVIALVANIPIGVLAGLIANALPQWFKPPRSTARSVVLEVDETGTKVRYTADGAPIDHATFLSLVSLLQQRRSDRPNAFPGSSPEPNRPIPIFLEHTRRLIGWGRVEATDKGLEVHDAKITDDEAYSRIQKGELKGFSIAGLVRKATCGICGGSYFLCEHVGGMSYGGVTNSVHLEEVDLCEISIVETPINPDATIKMQ
jgi:hypothetical protein